MKIAIMSVIFLAPFLALGQDVTFTVKGKVGEWNAPAKMYLRYMADGNAVMDSVVMNKGAFVFTGKVAESVRASLSANYSGLARAVDGLTLYLEKAL